jgi:signal recognition particle receptor subunit beta
MDIVKQELHKMMTDEVSLSVGLHLSAWLKSLEQNLKGALLLVYANKQDLPGAMTPSQVSEDLNLTSLKDREFDEGHRSPKMTFG